MASLRTLVVRFRLPLGLPAPGRTEGLASEAGVEVRWRPFSVRDVMAELNYSLRTQPTKMAYVWRDVERRAALHGVPFVQPPKWPTDPDQLANRVGIVAAEEGWIRDYTLASFQAWYLEGHELGSIDSLNSILAPLGRRAETLAERANSGLVRERYAQETAAARELGMFGSPSFAVGQEIFWGDDRLEEAIAWAAGKHPAQRNGHGTPRAAPTR